MSSDIEVYPNRPEVRVLIRSREIHTTVGMQSKSHSEKPVKLTPITAVGKIVLKEKNIYC